MFFLRKAQMLNVLGNFTKSVAIYGKFAIFDEFENFHDVFQNQCIFYQKL